MEITAPLFNPPFRYPLLLSVILPSPSFNDFKKGLFPLKKGGSDYDIPKPLTLINTSLLNNLLPIHLALTPLSKPYGSTG